MRVALGAVALAAALAVPAHAATASGIVMTFGLAGTCSGPGTCTATLTTDQCIERTVGPRCSADPVTISLVSTFVGDGVCLLEGESSAFGFVVHTEAYGDLRMRLSAVYDGVWQFASLVSAPNFGAFTAVGGPSGGLPGAPCPASFSTNFMIGTIAVASV